MEKIKTRNICLQINTYHRLVELGKKGESFDELVQRIIDE